MKVVLDHLTKRFPNRTKGEPDVIAVNDFTFEIPDGKLIGLLGPSGCGKSTCLNLISGILAYNVGSGVALLATPAAFALLAGVVLVMKKRK